MKNGSSNKIELSVFFRSFLVIVLYRLVLDLSYILVISRFFNYEGYYLIINKLKVLESYLFLIVLGAFILVFIYFRIRVFPSEFLLYLLFLFTYIPLGSLYALCDKPRLFFYYSTFFWFLLIFMYYVFPIFKVRRVRFSKFLFLTCTILFNMAVLFLIFKYLGISFNFDLSLVYEIRSRYVESNIPFAGYLFNWVGYAINPLFLSYVFNKRQWLTFIFSIFIQLLLFSQTGLKSFLFVPILVLGVNWLYQKYGSKKLYLLTTLLIGLTVALGILSYFLMGDIWVSSLLTRRTFYVPALLSFYYYDFFTSRGFTYLAQHRLFGGFLKYPYSLNPPHLIGSVYFGTPEMGANNGILGDSYMNFGFLGAILWSFVLILFFKILDSFCDMDKNEVLIGPLAVFANAFTNSALLTVMTTHGFLILLLFSIIIPKNRIKYRSEG